MTEQTVTSESLVEENPIPVSAADKVSTLSVEVSTTLDVVFQYIHEGFDQCSLMIGLSRFYEIAKAVRAKAESGN